jgi:hypothetical protein
MTFGIFEDSLPTTVQGAQPAGPLDVPRLAEFLGLPLYIAPLY